MDWQGAATRKGLDRPSSVPKIWTIVMRRPQDLFVRTANDNSNTTEKPAREIPWAVYAVGWLMLVLLLVIAGGLLLHMPLSK